MSNKSKTQETSTTVLAVHPAGRNTRSIAEFQQAIEACYQKNAGNALELGTLCKTAKEEVMDDQLDTLKKGVKAKISASNFSKLVVIGHDDRLYQPGMVDRLPGAFSVIYAIACIKPGDEWEAALAANVIHPGANCRGVNEWKRVYRGEPEPVKKAKVTLADRVAKATPAAQAAVAAVLGIVPVQAPLPKTLSGDVAGHAPVADTGGSIAKVTQNDAPTAEA